MTDGTERVVRSLSLVTLALICGVVVTLVGWFPAPLIQKALVQASRVGAPPEYVKERVYQRDGVRSPRPGESEEGLTMVAGAWSESDPDRGLRLIDRRGRIAHSWYVSSEVAAGGPSGRALGKGRSPDERSIHGFALLSDGHVLLNLNYVGTVRLDPCGEVVWRLPQGSHHSIERTEEGNFWIPTFREREDVSDLPGLTGPVVEDRMTLVSPRGEVLDQISVLRVLYDNGLQRYIPKGHPETSYTIRVEKDVTHLNDIEPLPSDLADEYPLFESGDLLVSLRKISLVFVLDPASGRVKWHASDPFIHQHDPDWMGDGWIGVFDNNDDETGRGTMLGGSRVVAIQAHTDSTEVLFPTPKSDPLYTEVQGSWQRLENRNLLLTESQAGRVVEVAPDGRTVWEWISPPYAERHVAEVTGAHRYDLSRERAGAWACSPESTTVGTGEGLSRRSQRAGYGSSPLPGVD